MNILITCCLGDHIRSNVNDIRNAYPDCKIIGVDMREMHFNHNGLDGFYRVPKCDDEKYVGSVLDVCKLEDINVVVSFSSLDIVPFAERKDDFDKLGVAVTLCSSSGTIVANYKQMFYCACEGTGIKIPKTSKMFLKSTQVLEWMDSNNVNEVVTKVPNSTGAKNIGRYKKEYLKSHVFDFEQPVIAQEMLSGIEYSVDCFCMKGKVVFGCVKKNYEMDLGVSIYSEIVDRSDIIDLCAPACELFRLDGLVGFDLKEDSEGNVYIIECNPRPTATISLVSKAGVNLLKHMIEYYVTGDTCFDNESLDYGLKIARFREDYYFKEVPDVWKR